ncbi:MAG: biotin--[acetyl-CoA-carboxylase] ligase [Clostridiales Family XIII bacterium]|jgi:BirA family biotin operon repressor/biotin-[acetyl-CoA-carboxylase] ligase|nr:biotin--[acetyl-CoA-carboxylase] ligase [Clostridiales Family XIII bacterium]
MNKGASGPNRRLSLSGKDVYIYREVSSTNLVARSMAACGADEGTVVIAGFQTAGTGRMQRPWICPAGSGITMSMILKPDMDFASTPLLSLLCGVAIAETAAAFTQQPVGLKWPNDVLINGKKACGILVQGGARKNVCSYAVVGIGLNVNQDEGQFPDELMGYCTSLKLESGRRVSRIRVLERFFGLWDMHYARFSESGHSYVRDIWIHNNVTLGRPVVLRDGLSGTPCHEGVAIDISERGGLMVRLPDGNIKEFLSEDLSLGSARHAAPHTGSKGTL